MPPQIKERFDRFENWLRKLTDGQLLNMLIELRGTISDKEFISNWGREVIPFSNWKKDMIYKELEHRELI